MPTTTISPLPRITTKTITAADLIRRILKEISEDYRRLDMETWITAFKGKHLHSCDCKECRVRRASMVLPPCETVACFAGWGMILTRSGWETAMDLHGSAPFVMDRLLGTKIDPHGYGASVGNLFEVVKPKAGTKAHLAAVVKKAKAYLAKHPELETRVIDVKTRTVVS